MDRDRVTSLSLAWLKGLQTVDKKGLPAVRYMKDEEDFMARAFLASALRSGEALPKSVALALADLIDLRSHDTDGELRLLVFKFRMRGRRANLARDSEISEYVRHLAMESGKVEAAIFAAESKFNLKRSEVYRVWSKHKPLYEAMGLYNAPSDADE